MRTLRPYGPVMRVHSGEADESPDLDIPQRWRWFTAVNQRHSPNALRGVLAGHAPSGWARIGSRRHGGGPTAAIEGGLRRPPVKIIFTGGSDDGTYESPS